MTNTQKFIDCYNELDKSFAKALDQSEYVSFSQRIRELVPRNPVVRRYKEDLFLLGNLRNAISHNTINSKPIAEPLTETIELIERILNEFKNPLKVTLKFQFEVFSIGEETQLMELLQEMKSQDFSQAPVLDNSGKVIEVISTNTISRWLFDQMQQEEIILPGVKVGELIPYIETKQNYAVIVSSRPSPSVFSGKWFGSLRA
jgi:hypothetical protein